MSISDRSKTDFDRAKIKLTGHFDRRPIGRYIEPCVLSIFSVHCICTLLLYSTVRVIVVTQWHGYRRIYIRTCNQPTTWDNFNSCFYWFSIILMIVSWNTVLSVLYSSNVNRNCTAAAVLNLQYSQITLGSHNIQGSQKNLKLQDFWKKKVAMLCRRYLTKGRERTSPSRFWNLCISQFQQCPPPPPPGISHFWKENGYVPTPGKEELC
jgi:hypothetical protein